MLTIQTKPLLITSGEPAGVGLDIICQIFKNAKTLNEFEKPFLVLANADALRARADMLGLSLSINTVQQDDIQKNDIGVVLKHRLNVLNVPCAQSVQAGKLNINNASHVVNQLNMAADLALLGKASAIITAPVQKSIINDAIKENLVDLTQVDAKLDNYFSGHTEFFQSKAGCDDVVMMLANDKLKVALVTTHLPLKEVSNAVTKTKLTTVIDILLTDMRVKFGKTDPKILVCGLNPHAGEGGHLGSEELNVINPVLQSYRDKGVDISLALPADTLFSPQNLAAADCFLSMYHDQGLTVLKALGFGSTVNLTLGLPFVRTSVDHGTALDIAGTGNASASSLLAAIKLADELTKN